MNTTTSPINPDTRRKMDNTFNMLDEMEASLNELQQIAVRQSEIIKESNDNLDSMRSQFTEAFKPKN